MSKGRDTFFMKFSIILKIVLESKKLTLETSYLESEVAHKEIMLYVKRVEKKFEQVQPLMIVLNETKHRMPEQD